jgi:hypothetical protein
MPRPPAIHTDVAITVTASVAREVIARAGIEHAWWPGNADATSAQITSATGVATQQLTFATPPAGPCGGSPSATPPCTNHPGSAEGLKVGPGSEGPRAGK